MGWTQGHMDAVSSFLRQSAAAGQFVPGQWVESVTEDGDGGYTVLGCGWALSAWAVAVFEGGQASAALPPGSGQTAVNAVLKTAGLTRAEIKSLDPYETWCTFDDELFPFYEDRHENPEAFILKSVELAEFFIQVLQHIPIQKSVETLTRLGQLKDTVVAFFNPKKIEWPVPLAA